jgi:hypothetical protein
LHVPIVDHPIDNQAFGSGTDNWRQRIRPGRLESSEDNDCFQKRRFAQRIRANDAGSLGIEFQLESRETAKVPYGKITKHLGKEYKEFEELQEFKEKMVGE